MREVRLPTSYLDTIPARDDECLWDAAKVAFESGGTSASASAVDVHALFRHETRPTTDTRIPLADWLEDNIHTARRRIEKAAPLVLRAERVQDEICRDFAVERIVWDCDWNKEHRLATLNSFRSLVLDHRELTGLVAGRTVVFGRYSGVSLDGHLVLFSGEVRSNWLKVIKRVPASNDLLKAIPMVEKSLSQAMRDIQVCECARTARDGGQY